MSAPIVVGTDGSPSAATAVLWAADEATRRSLPLRIVHIREPWSYGTVAYPAPGLLDQLAEAGEGLLKDAEDLAREDHPDLQIETRFVYGRIAESLREQSADASEIVVGHRGFGGFTGLLLGGFSLRVAGHIAGPVVVVRGDRTGDHGEIVVGIDPFEDGQAAVLDYAFEAASIRQARLRIVHAWALSPMMYEAPYVIEPAEIEQGAKAALDTVVEPWRTRYPDLEMVEETVREHPVSALLDASAHADLLVVGSRSRSGLGAALLGSVSHGVIHHATCPVAVVRPRS